MKTPPKAAGGEGDAMNYINNPSSGFCCGLGESNRIEIEESALWLTARPARIWPSSLVR